MFKYLYQKLAELVGIQTEIKQAETLPVVPLPLLHPVLGPSKKIEFTEKDNGRTITANKGDKVIVLLPFNPSSGFSWQDMGTSAGNLEEVVNEAASKVPGRSTSVLFKFNIVKSGYIVLSYARPWDELNPPEKWFNIQIQVQDVDHKS
jgi:predicted secreted protein